MSLGKFEPSYHNPYSRPRPHHGKSVVLKDYNKEEEPSGQMYFNGFSPKKESHSNSAQDERSVSNGLSDEELEKFIHIEVHPNGGASLVRIHDSELASLSEEEREKLARLFFKEVFCEEADNVAKHVIGIVHGAVAYMPELVTYLSLFHPDLDIKVQHAPHMKEPHCVP